MSRIIKVEVLTAEKFKNMDYVITLRKGTDPDLFITEIEECSMML